MMPRELPRVSEVAKENLIPELDTKICLLCRSEIGIFVDVQGGEVKLV